jgi:hypothetical protein
MPTELEVVRIFHELITPPNYKMIVCRCQRLGLFVNINTKDVWRGSLPISKTLHNFLEYDSNLECGKVYEIDDYVIQQGSGVIGQIDRQHIPDILARIDRSAEISDNDKRAIREALTPLLPST